MELMPQFVKNGDILLRQEICSYASPEYEYYQMAEFGFI